MKISAGGRWLVVGVGLLAGVILICCLLVAHGPHASFWPECVFHEVSGYHCAGCGMTRAVHACLRGDLLMAFRYNPLMVGLVLLALLAFVWEMIARWTGKPLPFRLRPSYRLFWVLIAVLLVFWVLRNIAAWPFNLLAPP